MYVHIYNIIIIYICRMGYVGIYTHEREKNINIMSTVASYIYTHTEGYTWYIIICMYIYVIWTI